MLQRLDHGPLVAATALAESAGDDLRAVILVEGVSDSSAIQALAQRRGRRLADEGVFVVPIGGAQAISSFLQLFGPNGLNVRLAGLCDVAEEGHFMRGLQLAGLGSDLTPAGMETLGFGVCDADLEDELIRCLGTTAVQRVVQAQGDLNSFRIFQKQPAQRDRSNAAQLRRFMGTRSGRKNHYARALVDALDLSHVPRSLDLVLDAV